jgi:hypothetical protein
MAKKSSWLTTLFGVLSAVGTALAHYGTGTLSEIGTIISVVSVALLGTSAASTSAVK